MSCCFSKSCDDDGEVQFLSKDWMRMRCVLMEVRVIAGAVSTLFFLDGSGDDDDGGGSDIVSSAR